MGAIVDSRESEKTLMVAARQFMAGRASIMAALTANYFALRTAACQKFG
jgi:hypothetical protein